MASVKQVFDSSGFTLWLCFDEKLDIQKTVQKWFHTV